MTKQTTIRRVMTALPALVLVLGFATVAAACPTCKLGLAENDPTNGGMVAGFFYSILFMMAMPFVLLGSFSGFAYLAVRRARVEQEAAAEQEAAGDVADGTAADDSAADGS